MSLADYKLIVSDLDGTLVQFGTDNVSVDARKAIEAVKEQGVSFTIATGRSWDNTKGIVRKLAVSLPVILQTGAIIIDPVTEKIINMWPLRPNLESKLKNICDSPHIDLFCLNEVGVYYTTRINTAGGSIFSNNYQESCIVRPQSIKAPASVIKHLFIGPGRLLQELVEKIIDEIKPRPNYILWPPEPGVDDYYLEVFDPLASKGRAIKWLAGYLKVRQNQIIAFGDGHNDRDLLKWAGLGVAMEGAPDEVASEANMVIPGPEQDGVARFLRGEFNSRIRTSVFQASRNLILGGRRKVEG